MLKIDIQKKIDSRVPALDLQLEVASCEFICISGKSGAGKTTFLRMIAGLIPPDRGCLSLDGMIWYDSRNKINILPQKREAAMVFQEYALFSHLTVEKNILYGARDKEMGAWLINLVELGGLEKRKPHQLSGGQKQRVALARALARQPKLLLLDEPFAALDQDLKSQLRENLKKLQQLFDLTIIMVSHDPEDWITMADRVFIISGGKLEENRRGKKEAPEPDIVEQLLLLNILFPGKQMKGY